MKIGFNSLCLFEIGLEEILKFAKKNEFTHLEIPCTPKGQKGIHHVDVEDVKKNASELKKTLNNHGVCISCLSYYANPLYGEEERKSFEEYMNLTIEAAKELEVKYVSTFTGYSKAHTGPENIEMFAMVFDPILKKAKENGVVILLENAPMVSGSPYAGNFAYSPDLWDSIFTRVPSGNLGVNYDPSHFFWMGVDYIVPLKVFAERIHHIQAKDSEILVEILRTKGIYGSDWFRYRLPGHGSINWIKFISTLYEVGYDGVISIENEDPFWWTNTEKAQNGLLLAKNVLQTFVI